MTKLEESTTHLGSRLRHFETHVCTHYDTYELPREEAARARRIAALQKKARLAAGQAEISSAQPQAATTSGRKKKKFNFSTIKAHSLGDYVSHIRMFGTTDSYSTQIVSHYKSDVC